MTHLTNEPDMVRVDARASANSVPANQADRGPAHESSRPRPTVGNHRRARSWAQLFHPATIIALANLLVSILLWRSARDEIAEFQKNNEIALRAIEVNRLETERSRIESTAQAQSAIQQSARDAADSLELSRRAIDHSRASFEIANRAWLAMTHLAPIQLQAGVDFVASVGVRNSGNVPAKDVEISVRFLPAATTALVATSSFGEPVSQALILPGVDFEVTVVRPAATREEVELIKAGKLYLYLVGRITYLDGFSKDRRSTRFCVHYTDDVARWVQCPAGNWAT